MMAGKRTAPAADWSEPFITAQAALVQAQELLASGNYRKAYPALTAAIINLEYARRAITDEG